MTDPTLLRTDAASLPSVALQPGTGAIPGEAYLPARPDEVFWGRLPCATDAPVLTIRPGQTVTIDTLSHEGLLEDQGRDPAAFFAGHGVAREGVLDDLVALAASAHPRDPVRDGPHVVTGPIAVEGALPGDLLTIEVLRLDLRVPYGVISNRHGRGALPGEYPADGRTVSVFAPVEEGPDGLRGRIPFGAGAERSARFPLAPFLGLMGVAAAAEERPHSVPPAPSAATSTSSSSPRAAASTCPFRFPERSPTSATRTSHRATGRSPSPPWRRPSGPPSASTSSPRTASHASTGA
ncbi:hypothetical protein GCM10025866_15610 [Naasia aerilata]|uniref:Acetamidase/formamidase family protein n=1 Tax=Naasia aerilata TaxID=1162966 RepID=A0ABN6XL14_9MICO|nr:hypothetical protein GCM10025866_15610 [Naasia aerilata]